MKGAIAGLLLGAAVGAYVGNAEHGFQGAGLGALIGGIAVSAAGMGIGADALRWLFRWSHCSNIVACSH